MAISSTSKIYFDYITLHNVHLDFEESFIKGGVSWLDSTWNMVSVWNYKANNKLSTGHDTIQITGGIYGQMTNIECLENRTIDCNCFKFLNMEQKDYTCQDGVFVGPSTSLEGVDCSKLVLQTIPDNLQGVCGCPMYTSGCTRNTCPKSYNLPVALNPENSKPFITTCSNGIIFHPKMNHNKNLDMAGMDLSGIDGRGQDWNVWLKPRGLRRVFGRLERCPEILPKQYHCVNKIIIGPHVDLTNADFSDNALHDIPAEDFMGIIGNLWGCPKSLPIGIKCQDT